jgi:AcrR family transcriptional regulator
MNLLIEEGMGAVTARRVAQRVGLSHQIVHYYFKSMDDLLIAAIEHGTGEYVRQLRSSLEADDPLKLVTELNSSLLSVAIGTEITIYASRKPAVRDAVKAAIESFRQAQTEAVARQLERKGLGGAVSPTVATVIVTSVLRTFTLEVDIGVSQGHQETLAWLASLLGAPSITIAD